MTLHEHRLQLALDARRFEIEHFWHRALFFWGFIAAIFAAFSSVRADQPRVAQALAGLGFVSSVLWSAANRGSKYWHEVWEEKVQQEEREVVGPLYGVEEPNVPKREGNSTWLLARRFSVSRAAIALSDFMVLFWMALVGGQTYALTGWPVARSVSAAMTWAGMGLPVGFSALAVWRLWRPAGSGFDSAGQKRTDKK